jgi:hypothetical protein
VQPAKLSSRPKRSASKARSSGAGRDDSDYKDEEEEEEEDEDSDDGGGAKTDKAGAAGMPPIRGRRSSGGPAAAAVAEEPKEAATDRAGAEEEGGGGSGNGSESRFVEADLARVGELIGLQTIPSAQEHAGSCRLYLFEQLTHLDAAGLESSGSGARAALLLQRLPVLAPSASLLRSGTVLSV